MKRAFITLISASLLLCASCSNRSAQNKVTQGQPKASAGQETYHIADEESEMIGVTCYAVPASVFVMGDPHAKTAETIGQITGHSYSVGAGPVRETEITKPYIISDLIPADLYMEFLNDQPPDVRTKLVNGAEQGRITLVDNVPTITPETEGPLNIATWAGANAFCDWLSQKYDLNFRLPTEAEWELWMQYRMFVDQVHPGELTCAWCSDYYDDELFPADNVDPRGPMTSSFQTDYGYQCRVIRRFTERYNPRMPGAEHTRSDAWLYGIQVVIELD